jgi:hypothetical protein
VCVFCFGSNSKLQPRYDLLAASAEEVEGSRDSTDKPLVDKYVRNYIEAARACQPKCWRRGAPPLMAIGLLYISAKGRRKLMMLTAAIAGLVVLGLFLSMLSSSPKMDR